MYAIRSYYGNCQTSPRNKTIHKETCPMDKMDRRDFLKKTISGGIAAGSTLAFPGVGKLLAAPKGLGYDLVAVRGGEPDQMFDSAMARNNFV